MKPGIVVLGTGSHAKVVLDILESGRRFEIAGVVSGDPSAPDSLRGHPFLGGFEALPRLRDEGIGEAVVGIGGWTDNTFREEVFEMAKAAGFRLPAIVHPTAVVAPDAILGEGSMIGPAAVVETETTIGRNVIVSCASLVCHETTVGDHVLLSGGVKIGSRVELHRGVVVAFGATVVSRVVVSENAVIAAGAVVVHDVPTGSRVFGVPARQRRAAHRKSSSS